MTNDSGLLLEINKEVRDLEVTLLQDYLSVDELTEIKMTYFNEYVVEVDKAITSDYMNYAQAYINHLTGLIKDYK